MHHHTQFFVGVKVLYEDSKTSNVKDIVAEGTWVSKTAFRHYQNILELSGLNIYLQLASYVYGYVGMETNKPQFIPHACRSCMNSEILYLQLEIRIHPN